MLPGYSKCTRSGGWVRPLPEHVRQARELAKKNEVVHQEVVRLSSELEALKNIMRELIRRSVIEE